MDRLSEIVSGWGNYIFKTPEIEKLARKRASICATCPKYFHNFCKECGCPLPMKTRSTKSTNKCPLNKW